MIYTGGAAGPDYNSYTITHLFSANIGCQDLAYFGSKIFQFTTNPTFTIYNMDGSVFSSGSGVVGHNNSTNFNVRDWPENGEFPYLYSTDTVYPVRIYKGILTSTTFRVDKVYSIPNGNGYAGSFCFDFKNGIGYFIAHSTNSAQSPETIISSWDFNTTTIINDIIYPTLITSVTVPAIGVIQGAEFRNNKIFVAIGGTGQVPKLKIINPATGSVDYDITIVNQQIEVEGVSFINDYNAIFVLQDRDYYKITFDAIGV